MCFSAWYTLIDISFLFYQFQLILGNDVRPKQEVNVPIVPSKRDYLVMQSFDQIMDKLSSSIGPGIDPTKILDQSQVCTLSKSIDSVLQPVNTDQSTLPSCAPFISNTTGINITRLYQ